MGEAKRMTLLIKARWERVQKLTLYQGAHDPDSKMCVMEAVAFVAGEAWSDHPACACPVISTFLRSWNDALPTNEERDRLLKPLIPKLVSTVNKALEEKRVLMAADWLVRVNTPAWLRLAGLTVHADALANLPEITSLAQVPSIRAPIEAAQRDAAAALDAAWAAAWDAARTAAWDAARTAALAAARAAAWAAAWAAARTAARAAAWDAARTAAWDAARNAARTAAWAAAWAAAWDAARDAARDAAWAKLEPTMKQLQLSAVELVERMIAAKATVMP